LRPLWAANDSDAPASPGPAYLLRGVLSGLPRQGSSSGGTDADFEPSFADEIIPMPDNWLSVWAALSDEGLQKRLRYYLWLSMAVPDTHDRRVAQLMAEAQRRGKPEIIEGARKSVEEGKAPPPL